MLIPSPRAQDSRCAWLPRSHPTMVKGPPRDREGHSFGCFETCRSRASKASRARRMIRHCTSLSSTAVGAPRWLKASAWVAGRPQRSEDDRRLSTCHARGNFFRILGCSGAEHPRVRQCLRAVDGRRPGLVRSAFSAESRGSPPPNPSTCRSLHACFALGRAAPAHARCVAGPPCPGVRGTLCPNAA